jgi:FkbM family methyltransferase
MKRPLKDIVTAMIRYMVFRAPWGVREAILQACVERVGLAEIGSRILPKLKIIEVGVAGDRGTVTSSWNDNAVLPEYAATGTFAPTVTSSLESFFGDGGGTFIDVGANIGLTTIPIARNPRVRCISFEPEPLNFQFLTRNVARNAPDGTVDFQQVALYHSRGSMSLAIADGNIGDHRLTQGSVAGRRTIEILTVPLDDFLEQVVEPLAIKIDTQGAEPFIIAGGQQVLAKAGLLIMEFCPFLMGQLGGDANVLIELLSGFDRAAVMEGGIAEVPNFVSIEQAQDVLRRKIQIARATDGDYLDIMAIRSRVSTN